MSEPTSKTPRTDALAVSTYYIYVASEHGRLVDESWITAAAARTLERELNEANKRIVELEKERQILRTGLNDIASWNEGPRVTNGFDEPCSAGLARSCLSSADAAMQQEKGKG